MVVTFRGAITTIIALLIKMFMLHLSLEEWVRPTVAVPDAGELQHSIDCDCNNKMFKNVLSTNNLSWTEFLSWFS